MYLTRSFLVLIVALGCLDIWSVAATKPPRTTRPARVTSTTKKADKLDLDEDKKYYFHSKPTLKPSQTQLSTAQSSPLSSFYPKPPVPTVGPVPPPFPPSLYPVPSTKPPFRPPYSPPPQSQLPTVRPTLPPPPPPQNQFPGQLPPHNPPSHNRPGGPITNPTPTPRPIVDQYDNRYPDGSYEFRYELPDETVRYERGYFILYQQRRILVVKGYYSYRLPDRRYHTVYYTADQFGYRQDAAFFSINRPVLPRSLKVDEPLENELRKVVDGSDVTSTEAPSDTTLAEE